MADGSESEQFAEVPGGEAPYRKGDAAKEFQKQSRSEAADRARAPGPAERDSKYARTPRLEEILAKKKSIITINVRKRRAPVTTEEARKEGNYSGTAKKARKEGNGSATEEEAKEEGNDSETSSECSACLAYRAYMQLRRQHRYSKRDRPRSTDRRMRSSCHQSEKRAQMNHPTSRLESILSLPTLHPKPPLLKPKKGVDSEASSYTSFNSSDEPFV